MRKLLRFGKAISVSMFVAGLVLFGNAMIKGRTEKPQSFVVTYKYSVSKQGGPFVVTRLVTRAVNASSEWKETVYDLTTGARTVLGADEIASYRVDGQHLQYNESVELMNSLNQKAYSEDWLRTHTATVREGLVAGLKTYVFRSEDAESWTEEYYSPKTSFTPLKVVEYHQASGDQFVKEAISVQFRALGNDEFKLPDLPVRFDNAERFIAVLRSGGQDENRKIAEECSRRMDTVKQKLLAKGASIQ